jgi:cell division protein FtsQ
MDARIRQRRAEVQRAQVRRRRRTVLVAVLVLAAAAGAVAISRSPLFAITGVRVAGANRVQAQQVRDEAQVHIGQNLMTADLDGAVTRVRALPWVASAEVRREPPSTVVIDVVPRRPAAVIASGTGRWVVDSGGVVIVAGERRGLPRIITEEVLAPVPGHRLDDPGTIHALAVYQALPQDVRRAARTITAAGARSVHVGLALAELDDPQGFRKAQRVTVRFGTAGAVAQQVAVLRALLDQIAAARDGLPALIDVRVPSNPVVVPVGSPTPLA